MHVIGKAAAQRHELRAGRHRQKPAARQGDGDHLLRRGAGFDADAPRLPVGGKQPVERPQAQDPVAGRKATVAVAAPIAVGERAAMSAGELPEGVGRLILPMHWKTGLRMIGKTSPRHHRPVHAASQMTNASNAPTMRLTRSWMAKITGASCMAPRWGMSQVRRIQNSTSGQASQITSGKGYRAWVTGPVVQCA